MSARGGNSASRRDGVIGRGQFEQQHGRHAAGERGINDGRDNHGPPPAKSGEVFISTMQVPTAPVSAAMQSKLESFLVRQRACVDAYAATTDEPVGASVNLVVPPGGAPSLSARTVAEIEVLACFEARLAKESWDVETEARLLLHYGVPVPASPGVPTLDIAGPG